MLVLHGEDSVNAAKEPDQLNVLLAISMSEAQQTVNNVVGSGRLTAHIGETDPERFGLVNVDELLVEVRQIFVVLLESLIE